MTEKWKDEAWAQDIWYSGKVTRRTLVGWGGGAIGAMMLVPAPWRAAFGAAKRLTRSAPSSRSRAPARSAARPRWSACRWRSTASTRTAASMAGRSRSIVADDESKPDVGRRKTEKLLVEDKIDVHVGGFLSNICLACMPVFEENKVVNMISVCLDTTLTTTKCNRYSFRVHDFAPAQAVAIAPLLVNKMGKKWHIAYADYSWGQSTRDAYAAEIKKDGGEIVGTTGIPLGTADMTPFLSKIQGNFDGLFGIFFGKDGITIGNQAFDLGLTKKYKWAGDGAIAESDQPAGARQQDRGLRRHQPVYPDIPGPARYAGDHHKLLRRSQGAAHQGRSVGPAARPLRAVELRGDQRAQARHGEVEVRGPQGHDEADRGAGRPGDASGR